MTRAWVYEEFTQAVQSKQYPNIAQTLSSIDMAARAEVSEYESMVQEAQDKMQKAAEEKRAAKAAADKKKAQAKGGKNKKKQTEEVEEEVKSPDGKIAPKIPGYDDDSEAEDLNLDLPDQFVRAV